MEVEVMLNIAWLLWYNQNERWVGEALKTTVNQMQIASNLNMEFMKAQKTNQIRVVVEKCRQRPHVAMYYKVNFAVKELQNNAYQKKEIVEHNMVWFGGSL